MSWAWKPGRRGDENEWKWIPEGEVKCRIRWDWEKRSGCWESDGFLLGSCEEVITCSGVSSGFFPFGFLLKRWYFSIYLYIFWVSFLLGFCDGRLENFCFVLESHLCFWVLDLLSSWWRLENLVCSAEFFHLEMAQLRLWA